MKLPNALLSIIVGAVLLPIQAAAQYPAKPIRLIVPFPAGGPTDSVARSVVQVMGKSLGQTIVVENKPGADGAIAAQTVAAAAPDGYTLLFATSGIMALPHVAKPAPFDAADLAPISTVGSFVFGMYVNPSLPSGSMKEFVAYARSNPGKLNFGSANLTEQMTAAQFIKATGVEMVQISYKGSAQALPDLIAGRIQVYFGPVGAGLPHVKEGRLRMLAVLVPQRLSIAPSIPTMAEAGVSGVSVQSYQMFVAPARTPRDIIERLAREVNDTLKDPDVRAHLEGRALFIEGSTPESLSSMLHEAARDWTGFIRESGTVAQ